MGLVRAAMYRYASEYAGWLNTGFALAEQLYYINPPGLGATNAILW